MPQGERAHQAPVAADYGIRFGPFCLLRDRHLLLESEKPVAIGARALEILIALLEARANW